MILAVRKNDGAVFEHFGCDARWEEITGCPYPLSIHDRYETQEVYDALSR